jgi:phenylpropionate dioxygenase-like ring-hydroxylating dioxygenase large terminal subunit
MRFEREKRLLFRRLPLMLAASCEIPRPGDYKTIDAGGVPVLLVRGADRAVRAFLNACTHRGAPVAEGCRRRARLVCPYHGWTFDLKGELVAIASNELFGTVDHEHKKLREFPLLEQSGLIWVVLDPDSSVNIRGFLCGFEELLAGFGFESWHFVERRMLRGPNWKLAFDAHLEFYHVPVLHRNSFGAGTSNSASYYFWGPHQRLVSTLRGGPPAAAAAGLFKPSDKPDGAKLFKLQDRPQEEWPIEAMMAGEWVIFPNVSMNTFYEGGRGVTLSQIFPGDTVDTSCTIQTCLMVEPPDERDAPKVAAICELLERVVRDEDLALSARQQRGLATGILQSVCYGRNEQGLQQFHEWIERILDASDTDLNSLVAGLRCEQLETP